MLQHNCKQPGTAEESTRAVGKGMLDERRKSYVETSIREP